MGWYLIFAFVGAILCALLASSRGRSVAGWAILGALFPLIALLILALLPSLAAPKLAEQRVTVALAEGRTSCPHCAELILPAAKICPHCRQPLEEGWAAQNPQVGDLPPKFHGESEADYVARMRRLGYRVPLP